MEGGDAERANDEGMSLHKILGRSGIMRRGAEWDRRCNEILKISRKSRLAVSLKSTLHLLTSLTFAALMRPLNSVATA